MKTIMITALAILSLSSTAAAQIADTSSALYREIKALNVAMEASAAGTNAKPSAAFYADNAVIRTARRIIATGRAQIERYFEGVTDAKWKLDVFQVGGHPDAPYQVGRSTLIYGVRPDTSVVNFLVYWRRQKDGKLKIELDYY